MNNFVLSCKLQKVILSKTIENNNIELQLLQQNKTNKIAFFKPRN